MTWRRPVTSLASVAILFCFGCGEPTGERRGAGTTGNALLLAVSVFATNEDGSPNPLPARMGVLERDGDEWSYRFIEAPKVAGAMLDLAQAIP